ncbi:MAG: 50S ribosomal protein L16 [Candidatus Aenigmarchaeota archaeon]|nr:50S ribosomal protein L16 [Candidatus Aenigmarchaeota archaeon]MBU5688835.1 50S ribosomal protein L16 [Candidatus Aenigmarchaeota archaeon]
MALRPGRCVRRIKRPWTRVSQRKPKKSYVVGVPYPRIHNFEMGAKDKDFDTQVLLKVENSVQIRENALEAARIVANKYIEKTLGKEGFFMKILKYPHQILREHSLATGAGADRFSMGMRKAFGRPKGRAVIIYSGETLMLIKVNKDQVEIAKEALRRSSTKLPTPCKIVVESLK